MSTAPASASAKVSAQPAQPPSQPSGAPCPILATTAVEKDAAPVESTELDKSAQPSNSAVLHVGESGLIVKRLVVTSGVNAREPLVTEGDLPADGTPIFAFVELANTSDRDQEIRVTFEREGSGERVGNVSLTVPAKSPRYRTWAKTRFVREAGTWVAVVADELGTELGRATFTGSSPASSPFGEM